MSESTPPGLPRTLLALDTPLAPGGVEETATHHALAAFIQDGPNKMVWIRGPAGAGKTTTVASVLQTVSGFNAIRRVACHPSLRIEEVLYQLSDFLRHLGIDELSRVLDQRTSLMAKIGVFLDVLAKHPLIVWWDDIHLLQAPGEEDQGDEIVEAFLTRCTSLPEDCQGRLLFTAETAPPPDVRLPEIPFSPLSAQESEGIWGRLIGQGNLAPPRVGDLGFSEPVWSLPLHLRLLSGILARIGRSGIEDLSGRRHATPSLGDMVTTLLSSLPPESRRLLEAIAAFGRPMGKKALLHLERRGADEPPLEEPALDAMLEELAEHALVTLDSETGSGPSVCFLHPAVQQHVETITQKDQLQRWKTLRASAGSYFLRLGSKGGDIWHYYWSRHHFFDAGQHDKACQLHKAFLEELLKCGYLDLARRVLSETIATTTGPQRAVALGNLAIIHKNEADYENALQLYARAREELTLLDDQPNMARVLHQIGNTLYLKGDLKEALQSYRASHDISMGLGDRMVATATKVQIANVLCGLGKEDEALRDYEETVNELRDSTNRSMVAAVHLQMGNVHLQSGRYLEAESSFREAEQETRKGNDKRGLVKALRCRARVTRELREYDQALALYQQVETTAAELGDWVELINCLVLKGDLETIRAQLGKALAHYLDAQDSLADLERSKTVSSQQVQIVKNAVGEKVDELAGRMGTEAFDRVVNARAEQSAGENDFGLH